MLTAIIYCSTEENLEFVNNNGTEAVSLDNDNEIENAPPVESDEILNEVTRCKIFEKKIKI